ncbi:cytochrome c [Marinobacter sp.]|uniref:c-type cytochrome n=1 Tax=Marinobacter sp. TaxID=50741 RepID=UPI0035651FD4
MGIPKDLWLPMVNLSNIKVLVSQAFQHAGTGSGELEMNRFCFNALRYWWLLAVLVMSPGSAFSGEAKTEAELKNFVVQDCGSCHGLTFKGGLGPPLRPSDIELLSEAAIEAVIREGVPGTAMPPWKALLTNEEMAWISRQLKSGALLDDAGNSP